MIADIVNLEKKHMSILPIKNPKQNPSDFCWKCLIGRKIICFCSMYLIGRTKSSVFVRCIWLEEQNNLFLLEVSDLKNTYLILLHCICLQAIIEITIFFFSEIKRLIEIRNVSLFFSSTHDFMASSVLKIRNCGNYI